MKRAIFILAAAAALILCVTVIYAQMIDNGRKVKRSKKSKVTMVLDEKILSKATMIEYNYSNGTVSPEYHFNIMVTVTPDKVIAQRRKGYDGKTVFEKSFDITAEQYKEFMNNILGQNMRKQKENREALVCGGKSESIYVYEGEKVIFSAARGELEIAKGSMDTYFINIVPESSRGLLSK